MPPSLRVQVVDSERCLLVPSSTPPSVLPSPLGRDVRLLWSSTAISSVGAGATMAAAPLLAASLTDDPLLIGLGITAFTIPFLLFGLPVGVLIDRVELRRWVVGVDAAQAVLLAAFAFALASGAASLTLLYTVMFLMGAADVFSKNAEQVLVPAIARTSQLSDANARIIASQEVGSGFLGPLIGGALFTVGFAVPFGVNAATFAISVLLFGRIGTIARPVTGVEEPREPLRRQVTFGVRWLLRHRVLRTLAVASCLINLVGGAGLSVLVVLSRDVLDMGPLGFGCLLACQALGALVAARAAPLVARKVGREGALVLTATALAMSGVLLAAVPEAVVAGVALTLFSFATVTWNVVVVVLRQTLVPAEFLGRVNSAYRLIAWAGLPVGAALGGLVAATMTVEAVYWIEGAASAVLGVVLTLGARRNWIARADRETETS